MSHNPRLPYGRRATSIASATTVDKDRLRARHAGRRIDQAIHDAFRSTTETAAFAELLGVVRQRSDLLRNNRNTGHGLPQVEALRNLAEFAPDFLRPPSSWRGAAGSIYEVIASLAQFLLGRYPVPRFLCSAWYGGRSEYERRKRHWFICHAGGSRFRDLDLPIPMTRRMERHFLASPDHLAIEVALRRAELLALGATKELAAAVCATRLGTDVSRSAFWRTVGQFFVRVSARLDLSDVGPIVDFIHATRHETVESAGLWDIGPPDPSFSIKGRSLASVLRLVDHWHHVLGHASIARISWNGSRFRPITFQAPATDDEPVIFEIVELTNSTQLQAEGQALQHCVAGYALECCRGSSRIWSLRRRRETSVSSIVTIEVDPCRNAIVQARGKRNRRPTGQVLQWIECWARKENLKMAL